MSTTYTDSARVRYRQESFAAQTSETGSLVSFIRLDVDARRSSAKAVQLRLKPSVRKLRSVLAFSRGGAVKRSVLTYRIKRGTRRTVYLAWINYPGRRTIAVDAARYERARRAVVAYWNGRLSEGTQIVVPERRVNDAYRNLVIQNLLLTWRYSIGNPYEQFSFPEGVDVAEVMGELGYAGVARSIMRTSLTRKDVPYPNWKMGKRLVGSALHYRLTRDRAYVDGATPTLRALRRRARTPDRRERHGAARPGALLVGHPGRGARAALAGDRVAGPAGDGTRLGGHGERGARAALRDAREAARGRPPARGRLLAAAARRRVALRPGAAARPRAGLRLADRGEARQLLEPRDAVCARVRALRAGQPRGDRDPQVHAPPRVAPASASSAPAPTRSTSGRSTRSPAPTRSTGSTSPASSRTATSPTSSCSASTARSPSR